MGQSASKVARTSRNVRRDPLTGFGRGSPGTQVPQEDKQRDFLLSQQKPAKKEMPPDLVKFISDMGPLKHKDGVDVPIKRKTSSQRDATRRVESMKLAENIEGFETNRTTSFSTTQEEPDPDDAGLTTLEMYDLIKNREPKGELEKLTKQYLDLPVLLKDEDDSIIGSPSDKVDTLLMVHRKMKRLPESSVKLVVQDLHEMEKS